MLKASQETVSESVPSTPNTDNSNPIVINVVTDVQQIASLPAQYVDGRESELSRVAVLAYD